MNPRKIRALREVATELLRIEDALKNEVEAARTTRLIVAELIPTERAPQPDEPAPPRGRPNPRPVRPDPPAQVGDVAFQVNGEEVVLRPAEGRHATHILGDLALVAWVDGKDREAAIVHAFPSNEPIALANARVSSGMWSRKFVESPAELLPGHGIFVSSNTSELNSPLPAVNEWLEELTLGGGGLEVVDGIQVYGNGDANEGGGQLIYPYIGHWANSGAGTLCAQWVMEGYAARMPVFRWGRAAFEQGRIEPHRWGEDFQGIDRTSTYAPEGYALPELHYTEVGRSLLPKVGGTHDALDHQHLGRIGHVTAWCARQGSPMARVILNALAEDVRQSWCVDHGFGKRQVEGLDSPNLVYWSCYDIFREYPAHDGCEFTGRELGQAMMLLANAVMYADGDQEDLVLMIESMGHVYDRRNKTVSKLTKIAKPFTYESGAYRHKRYDENNGHRIPDGETPDMVKQFETGILICGLDLSEKAMGGETALTAQMIGGLAVSLKQHDAWVRVIGHDDWSSDGPQDWSPLVLGIPRLEFGASVADLRELAETVKPNDGSNPCAAFAGDWEDLA